MRIEQPTTGISPFETNTKDKSFLEVFNPELSGCIINFLRKRGYFVVSYFDCFKDKRRILATPIKINQSNIGFKTNTVHFISIDFKSGKQETPKSYINDILKSGGVYLSISSLQEFYNMFELITGKGLQ